MWPQALCNAQITHSALGSKYQYIDINSATGMRIWRKAQEKYSWFLYWGLCSPLLSHLQCLFPDSLLFSFAKSTTWKHPPTSTIPFSSLHRSLLPTSTLFLSSFFRLQEKTERSYNLDIVQMYFFQLYKLCLSHTAIISEHGLQAMSLSRSTHTE